MRRLLASVVILSTIALSCSGGGNTGGEGTIDGKCERELSVKVDSNGVSWRCQHPKGDLRELRWVQISR